MSEFLILLAGGLVAGVLGGMLGLGGGIVLMPLLRFGLGFPTPLASGTCVLAVFFTTLGGSYRHYRLGNVQLAPIIPVIVAGAAATVVASILFARLAAHSRWLDLGIGLVFSLVAARMLAEGLSGTLEPKTKAPPNTAIRGSLTAKLSIGTVAGALPGLLGIGTGGILVPAFTFFLKIPIKAAVGASLVCFCITSLISAVFKLHQGYIDLNIAFPACLGTLIGANWGALLNQRLSSSTLKLVFGLAFAYLSLKFVHCCFEVTS